MTRGFLIIAVLIVFTALGIAVAIGHHAKNVAIDERRQQEQKTLEKFYRGGKVGADHRGR